MHLLYDHERASPNRAAGHIHILLHAKPGARLTLKFRNLDNVWNGVRSSIARSVKMVVVSENGRDWKPVPLENLPGDRIRLTLEMLKAQSVGHAELRVQIETLQELARQLDQDVAFRVWELRPTALQEEGLHSALTSYVHNWSKHFGIKVQLHTSRPPEGSGTSRG